MPSILRETVAKLRGGITNVPLNDAGLAIAVAEVMASTCIVSTFSAIVVVVSVACSIGLGCSFEELQAVISNSARGNTICLISLFFI